MNEKIKVSAITSANNKGIADRIITPVEVKNSITGISFDTNGIWDTGATASVVTKSTAAKLGLIPVGQTLVLGVHGKKRVNVYDITLTLNNRDITLRTLVTECDELSADNSVGVLIGMNVITKGDFAITNHEGHTVMSFRVPSLQTIDFVAGIKSSQPVVKGKQPGRNDPCPCGSGKKYKNCCGKNG